MSSETPNYHRRKYRARSMAAGAVSCPACNYRLRDRDRDQILQICPSCGFSGQDTMQIFRYRPPVLEQITDAAGLFSGSDQKQIAREVKRFHRAFPQIHWRIVTADLKPGEDPGLYAFWLLNVSELAVDETLSDRAWTILLVICRNGDVALAAGYAAEIWVAGDRWTKLLIELSRHTRRRVYGPAIQSLMENGASLLARVWASANRIVTRKSKRSASLS